MIIFSFSLCLAKLDAVKTYMRMRRVPRHLQVKVIKWFDYLWFTQKSSDEEKSVGGLPGKRLSSRKQQRIVIKLPFVKLMSRQTQSGDCHSRSPRHAEAGGNLPKHRGRIPLRTRPTAQARPLLTWRLHLPQRYGKIKSLRRRRRRRKN